MRILVAIPCYNCEAQIGRVLTKLSDFTVPDVDFLIVENNSQDDTREVIKTVLTSYPQNLKVRFKVIFHKQNYGLGGSFKTIFAYASEKQYDHIVLFHGDDQASRADLDKIIGEVISRNPDCLLGARFMKGSALHNYSLIREYGNKLINSIFSLALRRQIYDIGSGLNTYKVRCLPLDEVMLYPDHIAFDVNLLLHFMGSDNKTASFFPIEWHEKDQRSNASNIRVGLDVLSMLLKYKLGRKNLLKNMSIREFEVQEL